MNGLAIPAARREKDVTPIERRLEQLLEDEGVAFGTVVEEIAELGLHRGVVEDGTDHAGHVAGRQRLQVDDLGDAASLPALDQGPERMPPVQLVIAIGRQQEYPTAAAQPASHVLEHLACRRVGPVEILQHQ